MHVKSLQNTSHTDISQYLRIATISNRNTYSFLYIGSDEKSSELLFLSFRDGVIVETFEEAKKLICSKKAEATDVIIIDLPYNSSKFKEFQSFLKNRSLDSIPVIYSCPQIYNENTADFVHFDDVIDLHNWQYDFTSKISFLKKTKAYNFSRKVKANSSVTQHFSKRVFDVLISTILLILLLPLFLVIAIAIRLESKGSIFYNSKRAGKGFKIFKFYKFRTMELNADKKIENLTHLNQYSDNKGGAKFFKISNDPRITKVGKFLRNTSLDELPQLFNVLKGDMSLVGNRPLPLYEASTLTTNEFVERFMAPAGMTGLWQIKKRGQADMSSEERIGLDISYARKSSMFYDLWIMVKTPKALFQRSNV